jgi:hypothetical protein
VLQRNGTDNGVEACCQDSRQAGFHHVLGLFLDGLVS